MQEMLRPRWVVVVVAAARLACVTLSPGYPLAEMLGSQARTMEFGLRLGLAVFGLMLVEYLLRRAHPPARWGIKPLTVGVADIFRQLTVEWFPRSHRLPSPSGGRLNSART